MASKKKVKVEKVEVSEPVKVKVSTLGKSYNVVIESSGKLVDSELNFDQANAKVKALETQDRVMKGKNWTKGWYKVIEAK